MKNNNVMSFSISMYMSHIIRYSEQTPDTHTIAHKGPSKNVNIFMSVQTVHFFRPPPPPPKVYRPTLLAFKTRVLCSTTFFVQQQKLTCLEPAM